MINSSAKIYVIKTGSIFNKFVLLHCVYFIAYKYIY